jgi:hypothetical protein
MRELCIGVIGLLFVAACGGSSFEASQPTSTMTTTVAESPEARAFIAAAIRGLESGDPPKPTPDVARCMARGLIDTVTLAKLKRAGVTKKSLEDPNADLPPALARMLSSEDRIALGAAMQTCGHGELGALLADSFAKGFGNGNALNAAGRECAKRWILAPDRRELIGSAIVNATPNPSEATQLADLVVTCLDVSQVFASEFHFKFSAAESTCIDALARQNHDFRDSIAAEVSGHSAAGNAPAHRFGVAILKCLSAEHLQQVAGR